MNTRPTVLTVRFAEDRRSLCAHIDTELGVFGVEKECEINMETIRQLIAHQCEAIAENNLSAAGKTGSVLLQKLLPREISEKFPPNGNALLISTNEHSIPWELLWQENFLGVRFALGRQLLLPKEIPTALPPPGEKQKACLLLTNPTEDLPEAQRETAALLESLRGQGFACTLIAGRQIKTADILVRLGTGHFDFIHYSGHIDMDQSGAYFRLMGGERFYLNEMLHREDFGRPFFFLNGCGGGETWGDSTQIVTPLIYAGSGPVLCTTMPVSDAGSRLFAEEILSNVARGEPFGVATKQARYKFCFDPHASLDWMCFAYYGNPLEEWKIQENAGMPNAAARTVLGRADGLTDGQYVISTSHLFASLLMQQDKTIDGAFEKVGIPSALLEALISDLFEAPASPEVKAVPMPEQYSENAFYALEQARQCAQAQNREMVPADLLRALLSRNNFLTKIILETCGVDCDKIIENL